MTDDQREAATQARRIEAYWRAQGYASVACEVVKGEALVGGPVDYRVRCNLVNGLPPDFRREDLQRLGRTG